MDKLDFQQFDERFQNLPEPVAVQESEIEAARTEWIKENILTYSPEVAVPESIEGRFLVTQASESSILASRCLPLADCTLV